MSLVFFSCFWSSNVHAQTVFGTTGNAAQDGLTWVMTNVLPQQTGLTVNGVVYRYTTIKNPEDDMIVYVQNEDAENEGQYIFRSADDWSGLPGSSIRRLVPVSNIPRSRWGDGSIVVEGEGKVTDPTVLYNYQYDPCFGVTDRPECPNYIPSTPTVPEIVAYDPMDDQFVQEELEKETETKDEEEEERDREQIEEGGESKPNLRRKSLEEMLGIVERSLIASADQQIHNQLLLLNFVPTFYYDTLPDTKYEETITLQDANLPDNTNGYRVNFAQDQLHQEMVNLQYEQP